MIRNAPLLDDGTPMPTRYWLVDPDLSLRVARLESAGGVRAAEAAVDPEALGSAHARYARERDAALAPDHVGPASERRRRRYRPRREVPARAPRVPPRRRRRSGRSLGGGEPAMTRVAAIDMGTNSTRLLVADVDGRGPRRQARAPSTGGRRSRASARASTATGRCIPTRSSARSPRCASTAA